ncbi:chromosome partitioning protein ParA [Sphingomonas sp. Leaf34]|jgi:cellulose biosynthesis protein BcsQ|uniref:ParA family protein n=1 Tax=Sphingomonas sp. Leaf34 TaxID=1736216 RepID=UPI0006FB4CA2|nr:ParA family protein [Sphingomonas sp. Leaf34]KQN27347.1 chromosome partitioning protein ParA [Sphingomonas sp. Leaf34]
MATVAIYSLKGGVGKTTLSVNLAWCAATLSARRTLLWDLDPQAASTWVLGGPGKADQAQAMFSKDVAVAKQARPTAYRHLDLIAADASLRGLDQLFHDLDKKKRLAKLLGELAGYDRVILDCPPGLTETADQVMRAADLIVIPVIPSPLSTRAYDAVVQHLGGRTALLPVHVMVDKRRALHAEALARHPDWPVIPMASGIEAMAVRRAPVGVFAPRSAAAQAFADLWRRIEHTLTA